MVRLSDIAAHARTSVSTVSIVRGDRPLTTVHQPAVKMGARATAGPKG